MPEDYIAQYGQRLFGLCLTLCRDRMDAEDLYQETWLKAMLKFAQYDPARPFEGWLTGICVNRYRDLLRRKRVRMSHSTDADPEALPLTAADPDYSALYAAIDRLPEKLRVVVILHYFHDCDLEKSAAALGVPLGTVKSRLHRAKDFLRKELEDASDLQF